MKLLEGTELAGGRYVIVSTLGQGSFGITYLAEMRTPGSKTPKRVAIKEFFMQAVNGREGTKVTSASTAGLFEYYKGKFLREAKVLSKLEHRWIVKVYDAFEQNNTAYYVMELIEGGSLESHISSKGLLSDQEAAEYGIAISEALEYLHRHRLVHLDLKPANIMLRTDGSPVVIDFGLSKHVGSDGQADTSTTIGAGTPGYAPVEQANPGNNKELQFTMDVYALGATLFKMITGQRPPDASDVLNNGLPPFRASRLKRVIEIAMSPMRRNRYQTMGEMRKALNAAAAGNYFPDADDSHADSSEATKMQEMHVNLESNDQTHMESTSPHASNQSAGGGGNNNSGNTGYAQSRARKGGKIEIRTGKENNSNLKFLWICIGVLAAIFIGIIIYNDAENKRIEEEQRQEQIAEQERLAQEEAERQAEAERAEQARLDSIAREKEKREFVANFKKNITAGSWEDYKWINDDEGQTTAKIRNANPFSVDGSDYYISFKYEYIHAEMYSENITLNGKDISASSYTPFNYHFTDDCGPQSITIHFKLSDDEIYNKYFNR